MTNVFSYFGIQDLHDLAARVLSGDPNDLYNRASLCAQAQRTTEATGAELSRLAGELGQQWHGEAAERGQAEVKAAAEKRFGQSDQFGQSARSFRAVGDALSSAQRTARELVAVADGLNRALDQALRFAEEAINALSPATFLVNWAVKEVSGVDLEREATAILLKFTEPIRDQALGLNFAMECAIRSYETVLRGEAAVLRAMPGIVRKDAGPVDGPGDADLRRSALFRSVYGRDPGTPNDKLLAQALDLQGDDSGNIDPNSRVVVSHIKPVPGAGVVYGSAFISEKEVLDPRLGSLFDDGDGRGFDPNADPSQSRATFLGPAAGLPQPAVPVDEHPQSLADWRRQYHPDQGHESALARILQYPGTRGDDFFQYPVGPDPYPSVNGSGRLVVPQGHRVG